MPPTQRQPNRRDRYQHLIAPADAALLAAPLLPEQKTHLHTWALERARGETTNLGALVDDQSVRLKAAAWADLLQDAPQLLEAAEQSGSVARRHVAAVAADSAKTGRWTPLLAASYAWGQGSNGYGPHRLRKVLTSNNSATSSMETSLAAAVDAMRQGSATDAYTRLRSAITGLGPAFYTKFLYFAGTQIQPQTGPTPLILDAVVAAQLRHVAADRASTAGIHDSAGLAAWLWGSGGWSPRRYEIWLYFAERATQQLAGESEPAWPNRNDLLELATFRGQLRPCPTSQ